MRQDTIVIFGFEIKDNSVQISDFEDTDVYEINNEYLDIIYYNKKRYLGIILKASGKNPVKINPYDIESLRLKLYTKLQKYNIKIPYSYKPQLFIM